MEVDYSGRELFLPGLRCDCQGVYRAGRFAEMQPTVPKRSVIARLALAGNIFIGLVSLFATLAAIDLARVKPLASFIVAASLFGIASFLLLWETIVIVRQSRTGTMPVAMSLERPLGWVSLATILVATLLLVGPFVGVVPD